MNDILDLAVQGLENLGLSEEDIIHQVDSLSQEEARQILSQYSKEEINSLLKSTLNENSILTEDAHKLGKAGLVLLALLACGIGGSLTSCSPFGFNPVGYEEMQEDLDTAWKEVSAHKYVIPDFSKRLIFKSWQSPKEFEENSGACVGFSVDLLYKLGPEAKLVIGPGEIFIPNYKGKYSHCVVSYKGKIIEPQVYGYYHKNIDIKKCTVVSYNTAMAIATNLGTRDISENPEVEQLKNIEWNNIDMKQVLQ